MLNDPRVMREIERTLNRRPITRHTKYKKEVESHVLEVQRLLGALSELDSPYDQSLGVGKRAPHLTLVGPHDVIKVLKSGMSPVIPSSMRWILIPPPTIPFQLNIVAHERLIRRAFTMHEFPSLVEAILSEKDVDEKIHCLPVEDAQMLVDVIDEVRFTFAHP